MSGWAFASIRAGPSPLSRYHGTCVHHRGQVPLDIRLTLDFLAHKLLNLGKTLCVDSLSDVFVNRVGSQQLVQRCEIMAIPSRHIRFENSFARRHCGHLCLALLRRSARKQNQACGSDNSCSHTALLSQRRTNSTKPTPVESK